MLLYFPKSFFFKAQFKAQFLLTKQQPFAIMKVETGAAGKQLAKY